MKNNTLQNFIKCRLDGKSPTTIKTYHHALKQFEEWLELVGTDLDQFSRSDVQQYLDMLTKEKKSPATIHKIWNAIKSYALWAEKNETIQDIRLVKQKNIKKEAPKALTTIERNRLIREIDRTKNKRNIAIVMFLLNTGLRVSELVSLDRVDIEISERKGEVTLIGKGYKERTIPLNAASRRALGEYLELRTDDNPALFLSNRGERISVRSVQALIEKYGHHAHQLRHTFITALVRSGNDISTIQSLSGHESADMILRYSQPSKEIKQNAVENLFI